MDAIDYYYIVVLTVAAIIQIAMFWNIITANRRPKDPNLKPESNAFFLILTIFISIIVAITILETISPTGQDGIPTIALTIGPILFVTASLVGYFSSNRVESDLKVQSSKVKNLLIFTLLMDSLVTILSILLIVKR